MIVARVQRPWCHLKPLSHLISDLLRHAFFSKKSNFIDALRPNRVYHLAIPDVINGIIQSLYPIIMIVARVQRPWCHLASKSPHVGFTTPCFFPKKCNFVTISSDYWGILFKVGPSFAMATNWAYVFSFLGHGTDKIVIIGPWIMKLNDLSHHVRTPYSLNVICSHHVYKCINKNILLEFSSILHDKFSTINWGTL